MKLSITSTKKIKKFYIKDLNEKIFDIELDKEQNIPAGWYELTIPFSGEKLEIQDILLNNESIKELIYTGFYTDGKGIIHQPANAVWDKNGYFSIWIHSNLGNMWQRFTDQIRTTYLGKNLFKDYQFTVDRPFKIADYWNETLKSFFSVGDGPNWWLKNHSLTPWQEIDDAPFQKLDKQKILAELHSCFPKDTEGLNFLGEGRSRFGLKSGCSDLPFVEIKDLPSKILQDFVKIIGYKRLIDIQVQTLNPKYSVPIHKDDHWHRQCYPYTSGAKKFYWTIENPENVYFKLGKIGLLPLNKPLFINTVEHVHAVVHEGTKTRTVVSMYGEL